MKTVQLNIDYKTKPQNLAGLLRKKDLQRGDVLNVKSLLDEDMVLFIVLVTLMVLHKADMDYANKVLQGIFGKKSSKEIHREIENKYGVEVELESIKDEENWQQFSKEKLTKAYGQDEPEYDLSMVKEPNAEYRFFAKRTA